jgi:hypothetical protein
MLRSLGTRTKFEWQLPYAARNYVPACQYLTGIDIHTDTYVHPDINCSCAVITYCKYINVTFISHDSQLLTSIPMPRGSLASFFFHWHPLFILIVVIITALFPLDFAEFQ